MTVWQELAYTISGDADEPRVHALGEAGFLFERSIGHPPDTCWSEQVATAEMDIDARARLRDAVVAFVRQHPQDPAVVTAYWALGKLEDRSLVDLYRWALGYYLDNGEPPNRPRGASALFQVLVALGNIGERPYGADGGGSGALDDERNARLARAYLARAKRE